MSEINSDPPTVGLDPETDNNTVLHAQHFGDNKSTSITSQTTKRALACTEDQQTASPQGTGLQVKKPRVQSPDCEPTIDPQVLSSNIPIPYLPANNASEVARQTTPMATTTASNFAPSQDIPPFNMPHPTTSANSGDDQGDNDNDIKKSIDAIRRQYWDQILILFGKEIPASMRERVLNGLSAGNYPWTSHKLYTSMMCDHRRKGSGTVKKLHEWMYGNGTTTHSTWQDTLRTKTGDDRKVPWVKREDIMALSVIVKARHAEGDHKPLKSGHDWVEECKLTYLVSDQDHAVENEYWKGFAEELAKDPNQTNLYERVMKNQPPPRPGSSANWQNAPIQDKEVYGQQEQSYRQILPKGFSGQEGAAGIGSSHSMTGVGQGVHRHLNNSESLGLAQQIPPPARYNGQYTLGPAQQIPPPAPYNGQYTLGPAQQIPPPAPYSGQ